MFDIKQKILLTTTKLAEIPLISNMAYRIIKPYSSVFVIHRSEQTHCGIHGITPDYLETCLDYLYRNGYQFLSLPELINRLYQKLPVEKKTICFTLDDGYKDQAETLIPVLLKFDIQPVFFLITNMLDKNDWPWDSKICWLLENTNQKTIQLNHDQLGKLTLQLDSAENKRDSRHKLLDRLKRIPVPDIPNYLKIILAAANIELPAQAPPEYQSINWDDARNLEQQGVLFAPHSVTHNIFSCMSLPEVEKEINQSKKRLHEELKQPANLFCYPTGRKGDFDRSHIDLVQNHGFQAALSAIPGYLFHHQFTKHRFTIPRIEVPVNYNNFLRYTSWIEAVRTHG